MPKPEYRVLTPDELLAWAEDKTRIMRLRSGVDVIPGGYMAALAPALVSWKTSRLDDDDPHLVVRNINCGGNPMDRTAVLLAARVPLNAVEFAEFVLVPSTRGGLSAPAHHAQLRFVFDPGHEPQILNFSGPHTGAYTSIPDLVLSWESWRAPGESFSLLKGLDTAAFSLSMRAYSGPQRFLEDQVRGRDWYGFRLRLPGGRAGLTELLLVALTLGDGVARRTISTLLQEGEEAWLRHAPEGAHGCGDPGERWRSLRQRARQSPTPEQPAATLPAEHQTYHSLLRSCATLARHAVCVTAHRMLEQGHTEGFRPERIPAPALGRHEEWMTEVARTDLPGMFVWAPLALRFLLRHRESIPANIPEDLDLAGLLERRGERPHLIRYSHDASGGRRPYDDRGVKRFG